MDLGHVTTDSSDSSREDLAVTPVVGHYLIDVPERTTRFGKIRIRKCFIFQELNM